MLARRIIPCLDVHAGRVVKGVKFVNLKDAGDPVQVARAYDKARADELIFLDITASHENRNTMLKVVRRVAESVYIPFTVGGGIRTVQDIRNLLRAGCDKVSLNTSAIQNPALVQQASARFGSQCIVVAIDAKREGKHWRVFTHGGRRKTKWTVLNWAKKVEQLGAGEILLTSMDQDGTKRGFDLALTKLVSSNLKIPVIASGGVGQLKHFHDAFTKAGADAALAASVFHFGEFSVSQVKTYLRKRGILVRR